MRDRVLERRIEEIQELIDLWSKFHEMIVAVVKGASFTEENNREFLRVKSDIARKFQAIADKYEVKTFPEEEITDVLSHVVSLEHLKKVTDFSTSQFENTWHRVYITLNKFLGHLENERDALARVSSLGIGIGRLLRNKLFIFLVILGFMFGAIFVAYTFYNQYMMPAYEEGEEGEEAKAQTLQEKIGALIDSVRKKVEEAKEEEGGKEARRAFYHGYSQQRSYAAISCLVGAVLCGWKARSKGRSTIPWAAFGFFCCPVAFLILLFKT